MERMSNSIGKRLPLLLRSVDAFWGVEPIRGSASKAETYCWTGTTEPVGAPHPSAAIVTGESPGDWRLCELDVFDPPGRLASRLLFDDTGEDTGKPYRVERFRYPDDGTSRSASLEVELLDRSKSFEWRFLREGKRLWAARFDAEGMETALWLYQLERSGRISECVQQDGEGRGLGTYHARYDRRGRLVELMDSEPGFPSVIHRFEYGVDYRRVLWAGGPAGDYERLERYPESDRFGNWIRRIETVRRDGSVLGGSRVCARRITY